MKKRQSKAGMNKKKCERKYKASARRTVNKVITALANISNPEAVKFGPSPVVKAFDIMWWNQYIMSLTLEQLWTSPVVKIKTE